LARPTILHNMLGIHSRNCQAKMPRRCHILPLVGMAEFQ